MVGDMEAGTEGFGGICKSDAQEACAGMLRSEREPEKPFYHRSERAREGGGGESGGGGG